MAGNTRKTTPNDFGSAQDGLKCEKYVLILYVAGLTPRSKKAMENIRTICEEYLAGRYELKVINIQEKPELARDAQIVAAPTLIKRFPEPLRKLIGDMSNKQRVLLGMDLQPGQVKPIGTEHCSP